MQFAESMRDLWVSIGNDNEHPVVAPVLVEQTEAVTMHPRNYGHKVNPTLLLFIVFFFTKKKNLSCKSSKGQNYEVAFPY